MAAKASFPVAGNLRAISSATGFSLWNEIPKSRRTAFSSQFQNWAARALLRPISSRGRGQGGLGHLDSLAPEGNLPGRPPAEAPLRAKAKTATAKSMGKT